MKGRIVDIKEDGTILIECKADVHELIRKDVKECEVQILDGRTLSDRQRRMCYALIGEIAKYAGYTKADMKEWMKFEFIKENITPLADGLFSLSNAPMDVICDFQRFLIDFIISNNIPCNIPLLDYADDIEAYVYTCLVNKTCCVCGKRGAELHHVDAIGMGNDRNEVTHLGRQVLPLCREHHTEFHTIGKTDFMEKYHLESVECDKTILKIYKLKK